MSRYFTDHYIDYFTIPLYPTLHPMTTLAMADRLNIFNERITQHPHAVLQYKRAANRLVCWQW